ncbi:hypothetical protein [Streptomyces sp. NPDC014734]|uniref:hypothetical protein n=1 Tax=Streptomyces sp. NPDC014734 TaxID=3364886 RepID=UPI0036F4E40B
MRRTGTTRRGAFTAAGVIAAGAVLAGCGDSGDRNDSARDRAPTAAEITAALRTEKKLRTNAARAGGELLDRYEQVIADHPATATGLAPLRDAVRAHVAALAPAGGGTPASTRRRTAATGNAGDAGDAVRALAAEERRIADDRAAALAEAPPELARLLASVAAAGAAHAYLLTELAKETTS